MNEFDDEIRKQLMEELGGQLSTIKKHAAIDEILFELKGTQSFIDACSNDYTRTYTKGEYTRYDRTQTGFTAEIKPFLDLNEISKIVDKYR